MVQSLVGPAVGARRLLEYHDGLAQRQARRPPDELQTDRARAAMGVFDRFRLDGRRALITGGSRGLGFAMARALAEAGAELILVGRDPTRLAEAAAELAAFGRAVRTVAADVGVP